jgi:drug/metabolite transporter (DMT)-like permease
MTKPSGWKLRATAAFATVYLVWGSTYLAIRVGVQELPPALFAGTRFFAAGVLLVIYARLLGRPWPRNFFEWKTIVIVGLFLLIGGNGLVVWGSQWVASNQMALIVATVALWIAGLGTLGPQGDRLPRQALVGLSVGFLGVALLLRPTAQFSVETLTGQLAALGAAMLWAAGSMYGKRKRPKTPPLMAAGLQSLSAGGLLCILGLTLGEGVTWKWSWTGSIALTYLTVFGAAAYAAYVWLVHEVKPAALGTYAYVNPAIAVVLGWWLLDETLDGMQIAGMLTILGGVVLVSTARPEQDTAPLKT